jgi:hypothetical protein
MSLVKDVFYVLLGFLLFVTFLVLGCGGCGGRGTTGGTETGNATTVSLRVVGYQSSAFEGSALTLNNLEVTTAKIVLDRIRFRPLSVCEDDDGEEGDDIRFDGPFIVDLLNPSAISGLEEISLPTGQYCRIELVFKKLESGNIPSGVSPNDPMVGRSILIEGSRSDDIPFEMTTEIDEEFKLENETTGFSIEASTTVRTFFIAFDLDQWFDGIDLSDPSIEVSEDSEGNPIILINDEQNEETQERIEDNIKFSADLFEDSDEDEDLDPEEQEDSLAAGEAVP